jgi:hypothetical protein
VVPIAGPTREDDGGGGPGMPGEEERARGEGRRTVGSVDKNGKLLHETIADPDRGGTRPGKSEKERSHRLLASRRIRWRPSE